MEKYIALSIKCPHCDTSLMNPYVTIQNKASVTLNVEHNGEKGVIHLCSFYGCKEHNSSIKIEEGEIFKFFCPHCEKELISDHKCKECDAPMIPFKMDKGGKLHMCSRGGCNSHYLNFQNLSDALRKMYNEFGYF